MKETYAAARLRLHQQLQAKGWQVSSASLKILWAKDEGGHKLSFRPQAVYLDEHSLFLDMRGLSVEDLLLAAYLSIHRKEL